jgi:predicted nuclease of restriction endonuclease-like RecB superfamily
VLNTTVLTKDLLRVSRAGGGYHPQFTSEADRQLAARVLDTYREHVGDSRERVDDALAELEGEHDFKLVRGFAKLVERDAAFEVRAAVDPERARTAVFRAAEEVGVVVEPDRDRALDTAAADLDCAPAALDRSLYADLDERAVLTAVDARWSPEGLCAQYDLSLAQTALFDATDVTVRSSDPRGLVSAIKRLRLMYEIERTPHGRVVHVTGPTRLFRRTRRYGTRFARLLRSVATANEWHLDAAIDDRGTDRDLTLTHADVSVPDAEPVVEVSYDSAVEADFAARFEALDLDWELVREPEPLETGSRVMIPDFAFDWPHAIPESTESTDRTDDGSRPEGGLQPSDGPRGFRVFFEIMGFWTPEYVEKKLGQLEELESVDMLVAVDDSLGVGEEIEARDARAIPYTGTVRLKAVRDALRRYETELIAESAASIPDELVPTGDVTTLADLATDHGVSERALDETTFPEHDRVGRTLVRPAVLDALSGTLEPGMTLADAEAHLDEYGLDDASAVLSALDYRVEWEGLGSGVLREKG